MAVWTLGMGMSALLLRDRDSISGWQFERVGQQFPIPQDDAKTSAIESLGILTTAFGFASIRAGLSKVLGEKLSVKVWASSAMSLVQRKTTWKRMKIRISKWFSSKDSNGKQTFSSYTSYMRLHAVRGRVLGNVTDGFDASLRDIFGTGDLSGWDNRLWYKTDIAAFFGNRQFLFSMNDNVHAKLKRGTNEYLIKGLAVCISRHLEALPHIWIMPLL